MAALIKDPDTEGIYGFSKATSAPARKRNIQYYTTISMTTESISFMV